MRGEVRLIDDESKKELTTWRVIKNKVVSKINLESREKYLLLIRILES